MSIASAVPPVRVHVRSTVVATFVAPEAGATTATVGAGPQLIDAALNVCTGVDAVCVGSHVACATTNQKFAPLAVVSKLVCVTVVTASFTLSTRS